MKLLYAVSEAYPLIKTGGLADVAENLPEALRIAGCDVRVLLPGYRKAKQNASSLRLISRLCTPFGDVEIQEAISEGGASFWLVDCASLYDRSGGPYQDDEKHDWPDNDHRFGLLSWVAAKISSGTAGCDWVPDILHLNDWQTGLAAAYQRFAPGRAAPVVMTIHNLSFPGWFNAEHFGGLSLPEHSFSVEGVEFYGGVSFMKAGLLYADRITTVSPGYAGEIVTEALGSGFHGLLAARSGDLQGILNGVNYDSWNPATDENTQARFSEDDLDGKAACKSALLSEFKLLDDGGPLICVVSRLTEQKGIDFILDALPAFAASGSRFILMGEGAPHFESALAALAASNPDSIGVRIGYDESTAHRIIAGADMILSPSRFEPCGLVQLYAMRYGTIPIVRRTGGLADTVKDVDEGTDGSGFVFDEASAGSLAASISRSVDLFKEPTRWLGLQRQAMRKRFTWDAAAEKYLAVYRDLLGRA